MMLTMVKVRPNMLKCVKIDEANFPDAKVRAEEMRLSYARSSQPNDESVQGAVFTSLNSHNNNRYSLEVPWLVDFRPNTVKFCFFVRTYK